jgi:predicted NAD/FAD-binding protein
MLRFPVATMIRFCHNHGLIQVGDRPQWRTVRRRRARVRAAA